MGIHSLPLCGQNTNYLFEISSFVFHTQKKKVKLVCSDMKVNNMFFSD